MSGFLGGDMGYGWSGVSQDKRRHGASLYRRQVNDEWVVQPDSRASLNATAPVIRAHAGFDLATYQLGTNGTLFGPQGGLRASLNDLLGLAERLRAQTSAHKPYWIFDQTKQNGDTEGGFYNAYGLGPFIMPKGVSPFKNYAMIGHHGQAYGLFAGLWFIPKLKATIALAITGTPETIISSNHPAFTIWEAKCLTMAAKALRVETILDDA